MRSKDSSAKKEIDRVCKIFFKTFCNKNGEKPSIHRLKGLFIKNAVIIKNSGSSPEIYDVAGFIAPRKKILTDGTLTDFEEYELSERTDIFGTIAQRFSVYQKKGVQNGISFQAKGVKTIQFVKTRNGWKISSLAWDDERDGLLIPKKYGK